MLLKERIVSRRTDAIWYVLFSLEGATCGQPNRNCDSFLPEEKYVPLLVDEPN